MKDAHAFMIGVLSSAVASILLIKAMEGRNKKSMETTQTPKETLNVIKMPMSPTGTPSQSIVASFPTPIKQKPFPENKSGFRGYKVFEL